MPQFSGARALARTTLSFILVAATIGSVPAATHREAGRFARLQSAEQVVFSFDGTDGNIPNAGLIADARGSLYGTTSYNGGTHGYGNVFKLSRTRGGWKETVLYNFTGGTDGAYPLDSLVFDAKGNLYGTAQVGGQGQCTNGSPPLGCGVVFELTPARGGWTETVLYSFVPGQTKGLIPVGGLVFDSAGSLYGTTWAPGVEGGPLAARQRAGANTFWGCSSPGCGGTVFELSPTPSGWRETDLYAFTGGADGSSSVANLVFDAAGNLYGTTNYGGTTGCGYGYGCGTAFRLAHRAAGWKESVLLRFQGAAAGQYPTGSLLWDAAGNLYSTASAGGAGNGLVFELSPSGRRWQEKVLYTFTGRADGGMPLGAVVSDNQGNLFGTTYAGGNPSIPSGVVYELSPSSSGWTENVLHTFTYGGGDGQAPAAPLMFGSQGLLYGTTQGGGTRNNGTVFSVAP